MRFHIEQFLCRSDNIALLLYNEEEKIAVAIDAPDGAALKRAVQKAGARLGAVLITHHHTDHIEGLALLKRETGAEIFVPAAEAEQIRPHDSRLNPGEIFTVAGFAIQAIATPGHTLGGLSYYLPHEGVVFSGDTLFSLGCGRIFEGNAAMMYASLQKLAALPPAAQIYCGHEYSAANARFALMLEPHNAALQKRAAEIAALREQNRLSLPRSIARELAENPFLRCDSAEIRHNLGADARADNAEIFARMRQMKDGF